ncbi:MAG: O-antigen ligase family protein [Bacteroides sp.]|nr:O-antigen ligase family protein [Bacteroides sp.]
MVNLLFFCTKTAALGCLCSVFIFWLYAIYRKRYAFAGVSAFGVLLLAGSLTLYSPGMVLTRFQATINAMGSFLKGNPVEATDASFIPRVNVYKIGWEMFKEKPVFGWGCDYGGEFKRRYEKYSGKEEGWSRSRTNILGHPHNQALAIMDSAGLVGLLALVWVFFTALRDVWRRKSLFWWIWFAGLLAICTVDVLFNYTIGFIYLCGFHGILFCELSSNFLHLEDAYKPLVSEKSPKGV